MAGLEFDKKELEELVDKIGHDMGLALRRGLLRYQQGI